MTFSVAAIADASLSQMFGALDRMLAKGAAHCAARNLPEANLLHWRLAPDMFPLARQIQIACDIPARGLARLTGQEPKSFPDVETSFAELQARVASAKAYIDSLDRDAINADPDGQVMLPMRNGTVTFKRDAMLLHFILPNLYFHVTAAYAILRQCGVELGKADFLGEMPKAG